MNYHDLPLEEKVKLLSGRGKWFFRGVVQAGIKEVLVSDGPHGIRKLAEPGSDQEYVTSLPATCFPVSAALASSWDRDLIKKTGAAIAREAAADDVSIVLGPGANIKRNPLCGRNFEYYSEDPFLSGELAASMISSIQEAGVGCSLKHFAVNNQERLRMSIDAVVDQRALHEIYLAGFEKAVIKAQPWTVMCSYNRVNGDYASENHFLLTEKLRNEWGFKGIVISDWGACNERADGLTAGLDIEMPDSGSDNPDKVAEAVMRGTLPEDVLNISVDRIINTLQKAAERPGFGKTDRSSIDYEFQHIIAREAAAESIVLLKNRSNTLPLKKNEKIILIGEFAETPRFQGGGSSKINPVKVDNLLQQIRSTHPETTYARGFSCYDDTVDEKLLEEAVKLAKQADKVIVMAGLPESYESEGFDRKDMKLPEVQNKLIEAVAAEGRPVIVCLSNGSPVELPWNDKVNSIVEGYLGGQAGGAALADVLTGRVNPSGKLAESFPVKLEDNPSYAWFPGGPRQVEYRESIYVGYRYYSTAGVPVLYPFGHGLSYTEFEYTSIKAGGNSAFENSSESLDISIKVSVKNTGSTAGKEVVQLYVSPPADGPHRPLRELKGFEKILIAPGKEKEVRFKLDYRSFACYNQYTGKWEVPAGEYSIEAGRSSEDIRLIEKVEIKNSSSSQSDADSDNSAYRQLKETPGVIHSIPDKDFAAQLGHKIPENILPERFGRTSTLDHFSKSLVGKILMALAVNEAKKSSSEIAGSEEMFVNGAKEMPLRAMAQFSYEMFNTEMIDGLLLMANKRPLAGIIKFLKGKKALAAKRK